jgi:septum formation protein
MMLERLGLPFAVSVPAIDEAARDGESPEDLVARLSDEKARAIAQREPSAVVIGSDQVAACDGRVAGKPGTPENAVRQLRSFSGKTVTFLSGLAVVCGATGFHHVQTVGTKARFRVLSDAEIERYVERERPLDCAGGIKCEKLGIGLLDALTSDDPTAIIGLPLIALSEALRQAGFEVP